MNITEKIGQEIAKALAEAVESEPMSNPDWTKRVKMELKSIGEKYGYEVRATNHGKEWLYDIVWVKYENNYLKQVFLACESELDTTYKQMTEVLYDFEKLLASNAPLKILITQTLKTDIQEDIFRECDNRLQMYEGMNSRDKILLINYNYEDGQNELWIEKK